MPQDENDPYDEATSGGQPALRKSATPLTTSKLLNQGSAKVISSNPARYEEEANDSSKTSYDGANPMDKLLAKLCESHEQPRQNDCAEADNPSSCSSLPITPATDNFGGTAPTTRPASAAPNDNTSATEEVLRLKLELAKAQNHITNLNNELAQSRREQGSGRATPILSSDSDYAGGAPLVEPIGTKPSAYPPLSGVPKTQAPRDNAWQGPVSDDCRSEISDAMSATGYNRSRGMSSNPNNPNYQPSFMPPPMPIQDGPHSTGWSMPRDQGFIDQPVPPYNDNSVDGFRGDRFGQQPDLMRSGSGRRGNRYDNRFGNPNSYGSTYGGYGMGNMGPSQYDGPGYPGGPGSMPGNGMGMFSQYGPSPIGTPLSPHATEFTSTTGGSWKTEVRLWDHNHIPTLSKDYAIAKVIEYRQSLQKGRHICPLLSP